MTDASAGVLEQYGRGAYIFYILWVICGGIVVIAADSDGLSCAHTVLTHSRFQACTTQAHARTCFCASVSAHTAGAIVQGLNCFTSVIVDTFQQVRTVPAQMWPG